MGSQEVDEAEWQAGMDMLEIAVISYANCAYPLGPSSSGKERRRSSAALCIGKNMAMLQETDPARWVLGQSVAATEEEDFRVSLPYCYFYHALPLSCLDALYLLWYTQVMERLRQTSTPECLHAWYC